MGQRRARIIFVCLVVVAIGRAAWAQTSTAGAIHGQVVDESTGTSLAGVTVVATSPALQGSQSDLTDAGGRYRLTDLPPGTYLVTFYYADLRIYQSGVEVPLGQTTTVNQRIDTTRGTGEVIRVDGRGTSIDPTSTNQGTRITQEQLRNIPLPGRSFDRALGQAPGSVGDSAGVSFSGSTSLENQYIVDGVNTTGLTFGTVGTPLINEFIQEIQVLTGGYQAEYGRATGGVINVVTKRGSNEFHGAVFATLTPYEVDRTPVREVATSIDGAVDLDFRGDVGFELGGPIIKDKLWFYVGFAPTFLQNNVTRTVRRQTDCRDILPDGSLTECDPDMYADGAVDENPRTGDPLFETVESRSFKTAVQGWQFVSKINYAYSEEHQGQFSLSGTPTSGQGIFGVEGAQQATRADFQGLTTDLSGRWSSKFNDNETELEAIVGWHRDKYDQDALDDSVLDTPTTRVYQSNLARFGRAGNESATVMSADRGCVDSAVPNTDPYPLITNCPINEYWLDSPGFVIDNLEDRRSAQIKLTQRVNAAGSHVLKTGIDVENNLATDVRHFTAGQFQQLIADPAFNQIRIYRYVAPEAPGGGDVCGFETDDGGNPDLTRPRSCEFLDESEVTGQTLNWAAFVQDSWQVLPNLTVNAGVRYEEQRLFYADEIKGTVDPFTMEPLGNNALTLRGMFAPRLGAIYDWTKEGRSKVYAHYARMYESIPMALNDFSFTGTTLYGAFFGFEQCQGNSPTPDAAGVAPSPDDCPERIDAASSPSGGESYRGGVTVVAPGTRAQYMDEVVIGSEYELLDDLTVGVAVKTRRLGRVLEDMSIDNAETFIIGNPGEFSGDDEAELVAELAALDPDSDEYARLSSQLEGFRTLRRFDRPRRDYDAIELVASHRLSRNLFLQGSYTLSRTVGNYPGLLNEDTGAALPNISTQYDLPELLANRNGPLPLDRRHNLKLEGFYNIDMRQLGTFTVGVRFRAYSGTPIDALASNVTYNFGESYLLPRGSQGRTPAVTNTDLHLSYGRELGRGYQLSAFVDFINLLNQEHIAQTDEVYTLDNVNPVVGGDQTDLVFAKQISTTGQETSDPISHNIAFGTPLARYAPLFIRVGARLSF